MYARSLIIGGGKRVLYYSDEHNGISKSPATPLFVQPFVQAYVKYGVKVPHHWPFVSAIFPSQRVSNGKVYVMTSSWGIKAGIVVSLSHGLSSRTLFDAAFYDYQTMGTPLKLDF